MKIKFRGWLLVAGVLLVAACSKKPEPSPARLRVLNDTLRTSMSYQDWKPFALELLDDYQYDPRAITSWNLIFTRALNERDPEPIDKLAQIIMTYPPGHILRLEDRVQAANAFAWRTAQDTFNLKTALKLASFAVDSLYVLDTTRSNFVESAATFLDTRGLVYELTGDIDRALEDYRKAISYMPFSATLKRRGQIYLKRGQAEKALADFVQAWGLAPQQADLAHLTAATYTKLHPEADAVTYLRQLRDSFREKRREELLGELINEPAPDFSMTTFAGQEISPAKLKGKILILDFWATWCGPCKRELPEFQKFYQTHAQDADLVFVAASVDRDTAKVRPFIKENGYTFPVAFHNGAAMVFGVQGIPTTLIIDGQGRIRYRIVGFDTGHDFQEDMEQRLANVRES